MGFNPVDLAFGNMDALKASNERLRAENAKLREQLAKARDPQRIGGTADPESFAYAIEQRREFRWQHATNDEEAIPYINNVADAHETENAKLRELMRDTYDCICEMYEYMDGGYAYEDAEADPAYGPILKRMRELGLEAGA